MIGLNLILAIPIIFVIIGVLYIFIVAKNKKYPIGYKNRNARRSPENWEYTQKLIGKIYLLFGIVGVILNIIFILLEKLDFIDFSKRSQLHNVLKFGPSLLVIAGILISIALVQNKLTSFYSRSNS
ncbi:SdpI family protein [uncultured Clostridium sp.]|jgi:preprotein translocase subunit YajC|uniref:SdpI family protein n=1 Tax=uncultured Clostridium sp. TaxID=59620 RepID=UPI00262B0A87|nr:SdpI family protein [uncultured Clostridium sp.]